MKKLTLSLLAASCALALTACSSHSGGSDNSAELRQTENALRQQLVNVETKADKASESASNANSRATKAETELKAANDNAVKLAAEVAAAVEQEKETAKKLADLELAQAKLEQNSANQQNAQQQNKAESDKRIAELEAKAKKAAEELENAKANTEKANAELEKLKLAEQKAQEEKAAAAKRLQDLENLQADEKARIPVSDLVFGGTNGQMKKSAANISGGVFTEKDGKWEANSPATTEGIGDLFIIDKSGKGRHVGLLNSEWDVSQEYESGKIYSSTERFPDVRFGIYIDSYDGSQAIYSQGKATPESQIPTTGTATYKGRATYLVDNDVYSSTHSRLTADVNFANKTIDFAVEPKTGYGKVPEMKFAAKITANSFAGDVNNIKTQGGFFGENASQLSGLYINGNDNSRGAYGAVKSE